MDEYEHPAFRVRAMRFDGTKEQAESLKASFGPSVNFVEVNDVTGKYVVLQLASEIRSAPYVYAHGGDWIVHKDGARVFRVVTNDEFCAKFHKVEETT